MGIETKELDSGRVRKLGYINLKVVRRTPFCKVLAEWAGNTIWLHHPFLR